MSPRYAHFSFSLRLFLCSLLVTVVFFSLCAFFFSCQLVLSSRVVLGLVSHVVSSDKLMETAMGIATKIASLSRPIVVLAKESVNAAYETTLSTGAVSFFAFLYSEITQQ